MKRYQVFIPAMALISMLILSCSKDNEQELTENGLNGGNNSSCDTVNIKFATGVVPILQANCYSCHGNGYAESGVTLDNYNSVRSLATNGTLLGVITHAAGYPKMPYNGAKLSDCNINKIRSWINNGAQNN